MDIMKTKPIPVIVLAMVLIVSGAVRASNNQTATAQGNYTEREVTFTGAGGLQLHGTLMLPANRKGKVPGVLLMPGSGPTDRNGNQPPAMTTDLLKQIAERLATEGFASLRFDKRAAHIYLNSFPPTVAAQNDFFSWESFIGDAKAAFAFLQAQPEVNARRTFLAGHSEGAMFAMQLANDFNRAPNAPAGLILLSSPGRTLATIIVEQVDASLKRSGVTGDAAKPYDDYMQLAINQLAKDGTIPLNPPQGLAGLFPPSAAKLLHIELSFDPAKVLSGYSGPVLVIQGEKDIQISPARDFPILQATLKARKRGTYEAVIVLSASHNLKQVKNENTEAGFAGPVAPEALDKIVLWLRKNDGNQ